MRHPLLLIALLLLSAAAAIQGDEYRTDPVETLIATRPVELEERGDRRMATLGSAGVVSVRFGKDGDHLDLKIRSAPGVEFVVRGPADHIGAVSAARAADGLWLVAWDEYRGAVEEGASFDVLACWLEVAPNPGPVGEPFVVAGGARFQARPSLATDGEGAVWVAWEEGPRRWGGEYRSVDTLWNNVTDDLGPLHTWRTSHLAKVLGDGSVAEVEGGVPMPSFDAALAAPDRRDGARRIGVFYERPEIGVDHRGGLWLAYRHVHQVQLSEKGKTRSHVEYGFAVDLLRLTGQGWSEPVRLDQRQRDGDQSIRFKRDGQQTLVEYAIGRSDRRRDPQAKGSVRAALPVPDAVPVPLAEVPVSVTSRVPAVALERRDVVRERPTTVVGERDFALFAGDLHRHTDLSLCFPFYDGSLDDAYRYARGPGALDFVAITDHARDLDQGNVDGLPWKRSVAEADRHHLPGRFVAFHAYERSQGDTDHNVISLRPDVLRPHRPPLREFWAEFDPSEVMTIPHATAAVEGRRFCGNVWTKRDDERRPLAEVYQAFRDVDSMKELQVRALSGGQRFGFIASSDHLSTSGAYAFVWVPTEGAPELALDREPIFEAFRARRTYGATARIELEVRSGEQWMGEDLPGEGPFPVRVRARGTAGIERVEFWSSGALEHVIEAEGALTLDRMWSWDGAAPGEHGWLIVRVIQVDGQTAWASPFFSRWERSGDTKR